jgi:hypothetical protein
MADSWEDLFDDDTFLINNQPINTTEGKDTNQKKDGLFEDVWDDKEFISSEKTDNKPIEKNDNKPLAKAQPKTPKVNKSVKPIKPVKPILPPKKQFQKKKQIKHNLTNTHTKLYTTCAKQTLPNETQLYKT